MNIHPYPMMDDHEVEAMASLIKTRKPKRVLEWGGGGSTLYWPEKYPNIDWVTIEHNPKWVEALSERIPENVTLLDRKYPEYYQHDDRLGKFDLIIVDGRKRVMCLDIARKYLKRGGAVILHDAGRERYAPGMQYYKNKKVLSPPKEGKDPRGLYLLTTPKKRTQGVIYMAWGENAVQQTQTSIESLWVHEPGMPVMVLGDEQSGRYFDHDPRVTFHLEETDPFVSSGPMGHRFMAGRIKPLMAKLSPFDDTLYVDADTEFKNTPKPGFDLLDRWDMAIAETETRDLAAGVAGQEECHKTAAEIGTPYILYHNSGLIYWRKNDRTRKLFDLWYEEWMRYQQWDEQVALLRALLRSDVMFLTLPYTWNCYHQEEAYIVHHQFGSGCARTEGKLVSPTSIRERNVSLRE